MRKVHSLSPHSQDAVRVLGLEITRARRARRWSQAELAARAGVSRATLQKAEHGSPRVAIGTVFEIAELVGVDLFGAPASEMSALLRRGQDRLAVLPSRVRARSDVELRDDF